MQKWQREYLKTALNEFDFNRLCYEHEDCNTCPERESCLENSTTEEDGEDE